MMQLGLGTVVTPAAFVLLTVALTICLVVISVIDLRSYRIPDGLSLPLAGIGLLLAWLTPGIAFVDHLAGAVSGFALFAVIGEVYFRRRGVEGLGLGDAKLFGAAGAWLGWSLLPPVLLIAATGALLHTAATQRANRATAVAFGPWLSAGFWCVWVTAYFMGR